MKNNITKLIDANNFINCLQIMSTKNDSKVWGQCIEIVNSLPDEQKHGHWEEGMFSPLPNPKISDCVHGYTCSACHSVRFSLSNYCPNCGAKMDEDYWEEPEINPCRGCEDYDGRGGCKSNGGCGAEIDEVTDE